VTGKTLKKELEMPMQPSAIAREEKNEKKGGRQRATYGGYNW